MLVSSRVASSHVAASAFYLSINAHYTHIRVVLRDTGADITGHRTKGKRKPTYSKTFLKDTDDVISALGGLGVGTYPSD